MKALQWGRLRLRHDVARLRALLGDSWLCRWYRGASCAVVRCEIARAVCLEGWLTRSVWHGGRLSSMRLYTLAREHGHVQGWRDPGYLNDEQISTPRTTLPLPLRSAYLSFDWPYSTEADAALSCCKQAIALTIPNSERLSPITCAMGISRQLFTDRTDLSRAGWKGPAPHPECRLL